MIENTQAAVYQALHAIYGRHRRKYRENSDSRQMCCMWSTYDPPDVIEDTEPFNDIEAAFGIRIDEDEAMNLYDMDLHQAANRIMDMRELSANVEAEEAT